MSKTKTSDYITDIIIATEMVMSRPELTEEARKAMGEALDSLNRANRRQKDSEAVGYVLCSIGHAINSVFCSKPRRHRPA